jgi:hypothetical protein
MNLKLIVIDINAIDTAIVALVAYAVFGGDLFESINVL